jgi:hypothetical protein
MKIKIAPEYTKAGKEENGWADKVLQDNRLAT